MNKKFVISQNTKTDPNLDGQGYEPAESDPFKSKEPLRNPLQYSGSPNYTRYDTPDTAASPERKNNLQYSGSPDYVKYDDLDVLNEYEQHARNVIQIKLQQQQKEAESLKSKKLCVTADADENVPSSKRNDGITNDIVAKLPEFDII